MTDIKLTIGAKDEGAAAILKLIRDALAQLSAEQARGISATVKQRTEAEKLADTQRRSEAAVRAHTRSVKESIEAARQANQALRDAANALRQQTQAQIQSSAALAKAQQQATQAAIAGAQQQARAIADQTRATQQATQAATQAALQQSKAQQQATQQAIQASRSQNAAIAQQTRAMQQQTQAQITSAAATSRALQQQTQSQIQASSNLTKALLKDTQAQISAAQQRNALLAQQTRAMQQQTQAQIQGARQATQATQQQTQAQLTATRAQIRSSQQAAQAALQQASAIRQASAQAIAASRAQASAQQAAARAQAAQVTAASRIQVAQIRLQQQAMHDQMQFRIAQLQANQSSGEQIDILGRLGKAFASLYAAIQVSRGILAFIKAGLEFNEVLQQATLGIATLITAQAKLQTSQGQTLEGMQALTAGMKLAEDQITQLRIAGIKTAATTEQLVTAFQQAVGPGLRAGLNLDEIRKITVGITQAAAAIGLPMHQLNEEVRSLLAGTITYNTRIAKTLGITNAMVDSWKQQGVFAQRLVERFNAFNVASERALENMTVLKSGLVEAFQVFAGAATKPLFDSLRKAGFEALKGMFDFDKGTISAAFQGIVDIARDIFGAIGSIVSDSIKAAIGAVRQLSIYFEQNRAAIQGVVASSKEFVIQLGRILGQAAQFVLALIDAGIRTGFIEKLFGTIAKLTKIIADNVIIVRDVLAAVTITKGIAALAALGAGLTPLGAGLLLVAAALTAFGIGLATAQDGAEKLARQQKLNDEQDRNRAVTLHTLTVQYDLLYRKIQSGKLTTEQLAEAKKDLANIVQQIVRFAPQYSGALTQWGVDAQQTAEQIRKLEEEQMKLLKSQFDVARARQQSVDQQLRDEQAISNTLRNSISLQKKEGDEAGAKKSENLLAESQKRIEGLTARSKEAKAAVGETLNAVAVLISDEAKLRDPVKVVPNKDDSNTKASNDFKQIIEAQIRGIQAALKMTKDALDSDLKEREISFADYVKATTDAERNAINAELALRREQLKGTKDVGEQAQIKERIQELINQRLVLTHQGNVKLVELQQQLNNELAALDVQRARQQQDAGEARRIELERQYRELRKTIEANQGDPSFLDNFINIEVARARADQLRKIMQESLSDLDLTVQKIEAERQLGILSHDKEVEAMGAAYDKAIESINRALPAMREFARVSGNEEAIQNVKALELQLSNLAEAQRRVQSAVYNYTQVGLKGLASGLEELFTGLFTEITTVGKAIDVVLGGVLRAMNQVAAQQLAQEITAGASGFLRKIGLGVGTAGPEAVAATTGGAAGSVGSATASAQQTTAAATQQAAATVQQGAAFSMQTAVGTFGTIVGGLPALLSTALTAGKAGSVVGDAVATGAQDVASAATDSAASVALTTAGTVLSGSAAALTSSAATMIGILTVPAAELSTAAAALGAAAAGLLAAAAAQQANNLTAQFIQFAPRFKKGGFVPSYGRADPVVIRAEQGEHITPVPSVQYYGKRVMTAIQNRDIPKSSLDAILNGLAVTHVPSPRTGRYATGGSVDSSVATLRPVSPLAPSTAPNGTVKLLVQSDNSHIVSVLKTAPAVTVQMENMRRNRNATRRVFSR